jgi:hypothetical protein
MRKKKSLSCCVGSKIYGLNERLPIDFLSGWIGPDVTIGSDSVGKSSKIGRHLPWWLRYNGMP